VLERLHYYYYYYYYYYHHHHYHHYCHYYHYYYYYYYCGLLLMYSGHASTHTCSSLTAGVLYTIHVETFLNSSASESAQSNRIRIFTSECVCVSTMASSRAVFAEEGGRFDLLAENS